MPNQGFSFFSPDPSIQSQQALLNQRMALAQALEQNALTPIDTSNRAVPGGYMSRVGVLEPLAKIMQGYVGRRAMDYTAQQQGALQGQNMAAIMGMMGAGQPQQPSQPQSPETQALTQQQQTGQPAGPTQQAAQLADAIRQQGGQQPMQQPPQAPQGSATPMNPRGWNPAFAAQFFANDPQKYLETVASQQAPTDLEKTLAASGVQPGSPQWNAALSANVQKTNYIAPQNARAGGYTVYPDGRRVFNPTVPEGASPTFDNSGNVSGVSMIPGVTQAITAATAAKEAGQAPFKTGQFFDPATNQPITDYQGNRLPLPATPGAPAPLRANNPGALMPNGQLAQYPDMQTGLAALDKNLQSYGSQGVNTVRGVISKWAPPGSNNTDAYIKDVSSRLGIGPDQKLDLTNPMQRQALGTAIALHENGPQGVFGASQTGAASGPPVGLPAQIEDMQKRYGSLRDQNSQAQTTISYLQNIKDLSKKADTGQFADRMQFTNSLLSLAGSEKATDAVTARNLLDKYSNQIVARLGQGGLGTDSARAILQSAYPNAHLNNAANQEAADNLIGANQMLIAKHQLLSPAANARDPIGYQQKEQIFDANADPRIWQWKAMPAGPQKKAFAQQMLRDDPSMASKIGALEKLGAL